MTIAMGSLAKAGKVEKEQRKRNSVATVRSPPSDTRTLLVITLMLLNHELSKPSKPALVGQIVEAVETKAQMS